MSTPYGAPQGPNAPQPGAPGQFPAAQQGQYPPGYPNPYQQYQAPKPVNIGQILAISVAGLGLLNFVWGFLPVSKGSSIPVFAGFGYMPMILFAGGLVAGAALLPKGKASINTVRALSVAGGLTALFTLISVTGSVGVGFILLVIFGLLQAAVAIGWWLVEDGVVKLDPKPAAPAYGQPAPQGYPQAAQGPQGAPPAPPAPAAPAAPPASPAPQGYPQPGYPQGPAQPPAAPPHPGANPTEGPAGPTQQVQY